MPSSDQRVIDTKAKLTKIFCQLLLVGGLFALATTNQVLAEQGSDKQALGRAVFAGGCFWCMEEAFEALEGVKQVTSGYMGGHVLNPSYKQVVKGGTGHAEVVEVLYDSAVIDYKTLLDSFWHNIDPIDAHGQFCDKGGQYRSGIFYLDDRQKDLALASKSQLQASQILDAPVQTKVTKATVFYPAEDYHQDYYKKNPRRYTFYKWNCGRKQRLEQIWGESLKPAS